MKRLILVLFMATCLQCFGQTNQKTLAEDTGMAATSNAFRRVHVFVSGKVQDVGFRSFVREKASELKLTGWVRNLEDNRVELVVEGQSLKIEELLKAVAIGPSTARVSKVEQREEPYKGDFTKFEIAIGSKE